MGEMGAELVRNEGKLIEANSDQISLPNQQKPPAEALEPQDSNCFACDQPDSWDDMIMCDGLHEEQWYHFRCVGIQRLSFEGT